jgi:hypothetical protein
VLGLKGAPLSLSLSLLRSMQYIFYVLPILFPFFFFSLQMSSAGNFAMDERMAMHELVPLYQDKHLQFYSVSLLF